VAVFFIALLDMQLHGKQAVAQQTERHQRIRTGLVLNQAIDVPRSGGGLQAVKHIAIIRAHIILDKTGGGDGQGAEVAFFPQRRRKMYVQEIGRDADIAKEFLEQRIMRCGDGFHWRTIKAPTSTKHKHHPVGIEHRLNLRGDSQFTETFPGFSARAQPNQTPIKEQNKQRIKLI